MVTPHMPGKRGVSRCMLFRSSYDSQHTLLHRPVVLLQQVDLLDNSSSEFSMNFHCSGEGPRIVRVIIVRISGSEE